MAKSGYKMGDCLDLKKDELYSVQPNRREPIFSKNKKCVGEKGIKLTS